MMQGMRMVLKKLVNLRAIALFRETKQSTSNGKELKSIEQAHRICLM